MAQKPDIKVIGLNLGEDVAKTVVAKIVRPYAEYYIEQSSTKIDDILLPFMDQLEKALLEVVDQIDGEKG